MQLLTETTKTDFQRLTELTEFFVFGMPRLQRLDRKTLLWLMRRQGKRLFKFAFYSGWITEVKQILLGCGNAAKWPRWIKFRRFRGDPVSRGANDPASHSPGSLSLFLFRNNSCRLTPIIKELLTLQWGCAQSPVIKRQTSVKTLPRSTLNKVYKAGTPGQSKLCYLSLSETVPQTDQSEPERATMSLRAKVIKLM